MFVRFAALLLLAVLQLTGAQDNLPNTANAIDKSQLKDISQRINLIKTSSKNLHQEIDLLNMSIDQEIKLQRNELRNIFGGLFTLFNIAKQPFPDTELNRQISLSQLSVNEKDLKSTTQLSKQSGSITRSSELSQTKTQPISSSESTTQSTKVSESTTQSTQPIESTTQSSQPIESTTQSTQPIESTTQSTQPIESTTQSTQPIESTTQSTKVSESTTQSTQLIESTTQSTQPIESTTQSTILPESTTQSIEVTTTDQPLLYMPQPNCSEALQKNGLKNGVLTINIPRIKSFNAYCLTNDNDDSAIDDSIEADNKNAWLVIQRRQDGSVDFNRTWMEYQHGFGNLEGEFFIGLDKLNAITQWKIHELWIQIKDFQGEQRWAKYSSFKIGAADRNYALDIGSYEGDAGDSLFGHFGAKFSTYDMDNDNNATSHCAQEYGAWWHKNCFDSNLNGPYANGIIWKHFRGYDMSLKYAHMAIRPSKEYNK